MAKYGNKKSAGSKNAGIRPLSESEKNEIVNRQKGACALCDKPLDTLASHFDMIRPWKKEGEMDLSKFHAICTSCHTKVSKKT